MGENKGVGSKESREGPQAVKMHTQERRERETGGLKNRGKREREAGGSESGGERRTVLLHSCCGPCSTSVIERLAENYDITVFFYNPNVTDEAEYSRRLDAQKQFIDEFNKKMPGDRQVKLVEGEYDPGVFFDYVKGFEEEPENGARCVRCFELRMEKTADMAEKLNMQTFATTLSVSPHKNTKQINEIGYRLEAACEPAFLDENFKKKDGFKRSVEMSKEYGLYRQDYCGCIFSKRK